MKLYRVSRLEKVENRLIDLLMGFIILLTLYPVILNGCLWAVHRVRHIQLSVDPGTRGLPATNRKKIQEIFFTLSFCRQ